MNELNDKQRTFIEEYVKDKNATQAALRAGYSEKTAYSQGQRLLKKAEIKKELENIFEEVRKDTIATVQQILEYYTRLMMGIEKDVVISYDEDGNVVENKVSPSLKERTKAADALAKRYGIDKPSNINEDDKEIKITLVKSDGN